MKNLFIETDDWQEIKKYSENKETTYFIKNSINFLLFPEFYELVKKENLKNLIYVVTLEYDFFKLHLPIFNFKDVNNFIQLHNLKIQKNLPFKKILDFFGKNKYKTFLEINNGYGKHNVRSLISRIGENNFLYLIPHFEDLKLNDFFKYYEIFQTQKVFLPLCKNWNHNTQTFKLFQEKYSQKIEKEFWMFELKESDLNYEFDYKIFYDKEQLYHSLEEIKSKTYEVLKAKNIDTPEYLERLEKELKFLEKNNAYVEIISKTYFLTNLLQENNIVWGTGRGSAVSSLIVYLLGITKIDPLKENLYFERFLNKERIPDIDLEIDNSKRELFDNILKENYSDVIIQVGNNTKNGFLKHVSGYLFIDKNSGWIFKQIPLYKKEDSYLSIWSESGRKKQLEIFNCYKYDILSSNIVKAIAENNLNIDKIFEEGFKSEYTNLIKKEYLNIFQMSGAKHLLDKFEITSFQELIYFNALNRKALIHHSQFGLFLKILKSKIEFKTSNEKLNTILGETHGVPLFQEQIIFLLKEYTNSSQSEIYKILKGKELDGGRLEEIKKEFENNSKKDIKSPSVYWESINLFQFYGLNKSHAVAFAYQILISLHLTSKNIGLS